MTLYEMIFKRKSIRSFTKEKISEDLQKGLMLFFEELEPLFPGIRTRIEVLEEENKKGRFKGIRNVSAPYYLVIFTEDKEKADMNAGYIMQQLSLYLYAKGIGSCYQGMAHYKAGQELEEGMHAAMIMAFGYPKGELYAKEGEAKRLPLDELCAYKEQPVNNARKILEAARLAPSAVNGQPWRFVVYENRIHAFCKRHVIGRQVFEKYKEFDFGVMLANVMVTAEELWVDVDLIRLDNITHISLPNNEYVISVLLKA